MYTAYDAGVNFFDNAEAYAAGKSEEIMGEVLKDSGWRRDSYVVSSKVMFGSMAQLALAWTLKNPNVSTTITGASRPQQVEENMKALDLFEKLDDSVMERIHAILDPLPEG